jgi:hypothetical protein
MGGLGSVRVADRDDKGVCRRDHVSRSSHVQADQEMGARREKRKR